jgi:hypothetical protein
MGDFGQGVQGAMGGAMAGSMFGPWGTAIGGGLGLLGGLLGGGGSGGYEDELHQLAQKYGSMQAPQAGPAATGQYSKFRANQAGLISQLEAMARGEGPSAATLQMREAMDRAAAAQSSAAAGAGGRGVNAGAALRNATNQTAAVQAQGARDTGLMRVNEQMGAIGQLGGAINAGRAADEGMNQFNAQQQNAMAQANLEAKLRSMGITSAAQFQALQMAMGAAGPGLGTQILAGGAQAFPSILQWQHQQGQQGAQQSQQQQAMMQQDTQRAGLAGHAGAMASQLPGQFGAMPSYGALPSQVPNLSWFMPPGT